MDKKGQLEVEIIRARGLVVKPGSKTLPGKSAESIPLLFLMVGVALMGTFPLSAAAFLVKT